MDAIEDQDFERDQYKVFPDKVPAWTPSKT